MTCKRERELVSDAITKIFEPADATDNVHHVDDEEVVRVHEEPNTGNDDELEFTP